MSVKIFLVNSSITRETSKRPQFIVQYCKGAGHSVKTASYIDARVFNFPVRRYSNVNTSFPIKSSTKKLHVTFFSDFT